MKRILSTMLVAIFLCGGMGATNYKIVKQEIAGKGGTVTGVLKAGSTTTFILTATPASGYAFLRWVDDATAGATREIEKMDDVTVTDSYSAIFVHSADLTDNYGTVDVQQTSVSATDTIFTLTVTPKACASLFKWNDGNKNEERTYTLYSDCQTYPMYRNTKIGNVKTPNTGGSITCTTGYCENTLTAVPNNGYVLYQWTKQVDEEQVVVATTTSITVEFSEDTYQAQFIPANVIQFNVGAHSSTILDNAIGVQRVAPTITVEDHWTLNGWADESSATTPNVTFPYFCAKTLYAVYSPTPYTISYNVDSKAAAITDQVGSVVDAVVLPAAVADNGWKFLGWKLNNTGDLLSAGTEFYPQANGTMYGQFVEATPAEINGVAYNSIAAAMAAAQTDDIIDIMMNTTEDVTVSEGQVVNINGNSRTLTGSITIENGGKLTLVGNLTATDLYMAGTTGVSSQLVRDEATLSLTGTAYFDYTLVRDGVANSSSWYGFAVPFAVDVAGGIYRLGDSKAAVPEKDIRLTQFNGTARAQIGAGWTKNYLTSGTLQPGQFYMMTINGTTNTWRFKSASNTLPNTSSITLVEYTADGVADIDKGWNSLANPMLCYTNANTTAALDAYIYNNTSGSYQAYPLGDYSYVVGCPLFLQVGENPGTIEFEAGDKGEDYRFAPKRMSQSPQISMTVTLANSNYSDYLYLRASENATATYQRGRDLQKLTSSKVPQLWAVAYGEKLAAEDALLEDGEVNYDIEMKVPNAGAYTLSVKGAPESPVYLLKDGQVLLNLSDSNYTIGLVAGINTGYSIQTSVSRGIVTNINSTDAKNGINKFIYNNSLYIMQSGILYNAQGKKIK